jgi:hypothetical protein
MKTKIGLMILPLLVAAGGAIAQEGGQQGAGGAAEPAAAQEPDQVQERAGTRKEVRRQGADMRRCLDQKTNAAVIRCAEPGRKP